MNVVLSINMKMTRGHLTRPRLAFSVTFIEVLLLTLSQLPYLAEGTCEFPQFLRRSHKGPRYWLTEVVYRDGTTTRESYINITVTKTTLVAKKVFIGQCDHMGSRDCLLIPETYTLECEELDDGKYIVTRQDHTGGAGRRMCYKFRQRNANVVQIWSYDVPGHNGPCIDMFLERGEWPWIANEQEEWDYCPARGGFNFRAFKPMQNEQVCPDAWKPNHMESECMLGEGFSITYASTNCSPFHDRNTSVRFTCWAHWREDNYLFVIAGIPGQPAQFAFRLDQRMEYDVRNITGPITFVSHMYFSPVTPIGSNGLSVKHTDVQQLKLFMKRGDVGTCYDESEKCSDYARAGNCSAGHIQEHSSDCKRSCGMCNLQPNSKQECHFGDGVQGDWMWYENDRKETVDVSEGIIKFSRLGDFVCKGTNWHGTEYKLFSHYKNGCRPRYTCMRMQPLLEDKKIEFQLSKSDLNDQSFTNCQNFEDDPPPIGGAVRSKMPKLLIPLRRTRVNTCGLNGSIRVTMTTKRGSQCHGTLSDWNDRRCGSDATLTVKLHGTCSAADPMSLYYEQEFICDSYITLEDDYSLLITKSKTTSRDRYACWIIKTYPESMYYRPWKNIYLLDRAQCGRATDFNPSHLSNSKLALHVENADLKKPCIQKPRHTGKPFPTNQDLDNTYGGGSNQQPELRLHQTGHGPRVVYSHIVLLLSLTFYCAARIGTSYAQYTL